MILEKVMKKEALNEKRLHRGSDKPCTVRCALLTKKEKGRKKKRKKKNLILEFFVVVDMFQSKISCVFRQH